MTNYPAITEMLKGDESLSLSLYFYDQSGGISNIRLATLFEPNPYKGKWVEMGDQSYQQGSMRPKTGFDFMCRDTFEALVYLERACSGTRLLSGTLRYSSEKCWENPGHKESRGGIDTWVQNAFRLRIQSEEGKLVSKMETDRRVQIVICQDEVDSVGDAISHYQRPINAAFLRSIHDGVYLLQAIKQSGVKLGDRSDLFQGIRKDLVPGSEVLLSTEGSLSALRDYSLTADAKNALFLQSLLDVCYRGRDT